MMEGSGRARDGTNIPTGKAHSRLLSIPSPHSGMEWEEDEGLLSHPRRDVILFCFLTSYRAGNNNMVLERAYDIIFSFLGAAGHTHTPATLSTPL